MMGNKTAIAEFYDKYYEKAVHSRAHAIFCERVYGINLCQHGMADDQQIGIMLDELDLDDASYVLDIGCGPGLITDFLQKKTGCKMIGIDISPVAIHRGSALQHKNLQFVAGDIENFEFAEELFDAILLIDTHYFIEGFTNIIPKLMKILKKRGKMAIFSDEGKGLEGEDESKTEPRETIIGKYLIKNDIKYKGIQLYNENVQHWRKKKQTLLEMESEFTKENNQFLFNQRLEECTEHDRTLDGRYLFIVYK